MDTGIWKRGILFYYDEGWGNPENKEVGEWNECLLLEVKEGVN